MAARRCISTYVQAACQPDTWWLYSQHVCVISALFSKRVRATSALRARGKRASEELYAASNLSRRQLVHGIRGYARLARRVWVCARHNWR